MLRGIARGDLHHRSECAGQDHIAGFQAFAALGACARQPDGSIQRMTQAGDTCSVGGRTAIAFEHHTGFRKIDIRQRAGRSAKNVEPGGGIVRDRV